MAYVLVGGRKSESTKAKSMTSSGVMTIRSFMKIRHLFSKVTGEGQAHGRTLALFHSLCAAL